MMEEGEVFDIHDDEQSTSSSIRGKNDLTEPAEEERIISENTDSYQSENHPNIDNRPPPLKPITDSIIDSANVSTIGSIGSIDSRLNFATIHHKEGTTASSNANASNQAVYSIMYSDRLDSPHERGIKSPPPSPSHPLFVNLTGSQQQHRHQKKHLSPSSSPQNLLHNRSSSPNTIDDNSTLPSSPTKINYGPVWKPGFVNRRNQSELLRNSFPAGFQTIYSKNRVYSSPSHSPTAQKQTTTIAARFPYEDSVFAALSPASQARALAKVKFSFHDWAKGGGGGDGFGGDFDDSADDGEGKHHGDPYLDVAGPLLRDIQLARISMDVVSSKEQIESDLSCQIRKVPILPVEKKRAKTPEPLLKAIFHAPGALPALPVSNALLRPYQTNKDNSFPHWMPTSPKATTRTVASIQSQSTVSTYDDWIQYKRFNMKQKVWKQKGNEVSHNYSAHSFNGNDPHQIVIAPSPIQFLPTALPPTLTLEVYTVDQLSNFPIQKKSNNNNNNNSNNTPIQRSATTPPSSNNLLNNHNTAASSFEELACSINKSVPSTITLQSLHQIIVKDIIKQIEQTFLPPLPPLSNHIDKVNQLYHQEQNQQYLFENIEEQKIFLLFYQYDYAIHQWKAITNETDWIQTKYYHHHYSSQNQLHHLRNEFTSNYLRPGFHDSWSVDNGSFTGNTLATHSLTVPTLPASAPAAPSSAKSNTPLAEREPALLIKLMYAMDKNSEQYILHQIQKNYEIRKSMIEKDRMTLSLQDLTEAIEKDQKRKRKKYQLHINTISNNNNNNTLQQSSSTVDVGSFSFFENPTNSFITFEPAASTATAMTSKPTQYEKEQQKRFQLSKSKSTQRIEITKSMYLSSSNNRRIKSPQSKDRSTMRKTQVNFSSSASLYSSSASSSSSVLLNAGPSILYPKQNPVLKQLQEDAKKSIPKLQSFAEQLQDRLLKTKF